MRKNGYIISVAFVGLALVGAGCTKTRGVDVSDAMKKDDAMMKVEADTMMKDDSMKKDDAMMKTSLKGSYEAYSPARLAYANQGHVVLFFHASWCPTCRAANENLSAGSLPDGLLVLKTDYDTSTELKKKYGVTSQHTFVEVDAQGNMKKKWLGSSTVAEISAHLR